MHTLLLDSFTEPLKPAGLLEHRQKDGKRQRQSKMKKAGRIEKERKRENLTSPSVTEMLDWSNPYLQYTAMIGHLRSCFLSLHTHFALRRDWVRLSGCLSCKFRLSLLELDGHFS